MRYQWQCGEPNGRGIHKKKTGLSIAPFKATMKCPTQTGEMGGLTWNPTTAISGGKIVSKTRDSVLHVGFHGTTCPYSLVERGMGHPPIQCQTWGTQILEAFIPRNNPNCRILMPTK